VKRGGLIQGTDLLLQQWQEVHRIKHHVGLLVGSHMARNNFRAAANHDIMDIATNLNFVMGVGHGHRVIIVAIPNH